MQILAVIYSLLINYSLTFLIYQSDIDRLVPFGQFLIFPISPIISSFIGISLYKNLHKKNLHPVLAVVYIAGLFVTMPHLAFGLLDFLDGGKIISIGLILSYITFYFISSRSNLTHSIEQNPAQNLTKTPRTGAILIDLILILVTTGASILLFFSVFCGMTDNASNVTTGCKAFQTSALMIPLLALIVLALISDIIRPILRAKHRVLILIFTLLLILIPTFISYTEEQNKISKTKKEFQNYISEVENIKLNDNNPILKDCSIKDVRVLVRPILVDNQENEIYSKEGEYGLEFSIRFPGVPDESDTATHNLKARYRYKIGPADIHFNMEELFDKDSLPSYHFSAGAIDTDFELLTYPNPITAKCSIPPQISNRDAQYYASTVRIHSLVGAKGQELEFSKYINQYFAKDVLLIKNNPAE